MTVSEQPDGREMAEEQANDSDGFDFERSLKELEELVTGMERGDLTLEESLAAFERGIRLTRGCQQALREAEQKVEILLGKDDAATVEDFEPGSSDGA